MGHTKESYKKWKDNRIAEIGLDAFNEERRAMASKGGSAVHKEPRRFAKNPKLASQAGKISGAVRRANAKQGL